MLNPGGMVTVEGQRLHAFSEGMMIDPDDWVEVLEVRGSRVLVRRAAAPVLPPVDLADGTSSPPPIASLPEPTQLDFDLPQG
jgi:membrane-bound serine protease (ClpP class)